MPPRLKKIHLLTSLFFAVFLAFNWIGSLTTTVNHGKIARHHVKRSIRSTSIDEIVKSNTIDETTTRPHYLRSKTAHKVIIPQQPCGYESCNAINPDLINVHLVLHSHNDPGYLKTIEQYYWGTHTKEFKTNHDDAHVEKIISNVIRELLVNQERRFMYVEMVYFSKWWQYQTEKEKKIVIDLVNSGRLEFVNGGWCENDEATTHYSDIIDQMSLGLRFLNETFGKCGRPKITSHLDSFGSSREQASIYAQMGYDGLIIGRVDQFEKQQRIHDKTMEMIWSGRQNSGVDGELFTSVTFNIFNPPIGFCFDNFCGDEQHSPPINDDKDSKDYNVDKRINEILAYSKRQSELFATNNIMIFMGSDFTYNDAEVWFSNIDKLIKYANEQQNNGSRLNFLYSTPACYFKALNDAKSDWTSKTGDFLPMSYGKQIYWTGFFTSRPSFKYMIRQGSSILRSCKQMSSVLFLRDAENLGQIRVMNEAMALMQHHDAITGTSKQHVIDDYYFKLDKGIAECQKTQSSYYQRELAKEDYVLPPVTYCQLNMSQCDATERNSTFIVNIYNSLPRSIDKYIRVPVSMTNITSFRVLDPEGKVIPSQLVPIPSFVLNLPGRISSATRELVFFAADVPPLGSKSFYVGPSMDGSKESTAEASEERERRPESDETVTNDKMGVVIDGGTGLLKTVIFKEGKKIQLDQDVFVYTGTRGNGCFTENIASGVYMFHPLNKSSALPVSESTRIQVSIFEGELVQEIHQIFNDWVAQVIRLYKGHEHLEIDWVIGPIPSDDGTSKEIISRFSTDFETKGEFYTDVNGHQTVKRKTNPSGDEPVASNYYPITSHISINDSKNHLNILTDRAQGGASIYDGELELMLHRRLLSMDLCQMNETLNEKAYGQGLVVRGTHQLVFSSNYKDKVQEMYAAPQISFIPTSLSFKKWSTRFRTKQSFLRSSLPKNVNILTFEPIPNKKQYLLRIEHIYDADEHSTLSDPVTVSLKELFADYEVNSIEETTLDGNQFKRDVKKLSWHRKRVSQENKSLVDLEQIELSPLEIRTFILSIIPKL